jgi:hypothetical protein
MSSIFVVAGVLIVVSVALIRLLAILGAAYDRATDRPPAPRTPAPWLRSMRAERTRYQGDQVRLSMLDRVLVVVVVLAALAFEVWFFFFSGSPI